MRSAIPYANSMKSHVRFVRPHVRCSKKFVDTWPSSNIRYCHLPYHHIPVTGLKGVAAVEDEKESDIG